MTLFAGSVPVVLEGLVKNRKKLIDLLLAHLLDPTIPRRLGVFEDLLKCPPMDVELPIRRTLAMAFG